MFSQEIINDLHDLYTHEIKNFLTYKELSHQLKIKGLTNLASYMKEWSEEEKKHSEWILDFLASFNIPIDTRSIPKIDLDVSDITEFYDVIAKTEDETNLLWDDFLKKAYDEDWNSAIISAWTKDKFNLEQLEETDKANDIKDKCEPFRGNLALLMIFDQSFNKG